MDIDSNLFQVSDSKSGAGFEISDDSTIRLGPTTLRDLEVLRERLRGRPNNAEIITSALKILALAVDHTLEVEAYRDSGRKSVHGMWARS